MVIEHRERKRNERPQVPRKAKKMSASKMESAMEEMGVEIQNKDEVCVEETIHLMSCDTPVFLKLVVVFRRIMLASGRAVLSRGRHASASARSRL